MLLKISKWCLSLKTLAFSLPSSFLVFALILMNDVIVSNQVFRSVGSGILMK